MVLVHTGCDQVDHCESCTDPSTRCYDCVEGYVLHPHTHTCTGKLITRCTQVVFSNIADARTVI